MTMNDNIYLELTRLAPDIVWRRFRAGIAAEFEDGFDAWILSNEELKEYASPTEIIEKFRELNHKRFTVIRALKWLLFEKGIRAGFEGNGAWSLTFEGGCLSSIEVGVKLTELVKRNDLASAFTKLLEGHIIPKPSPGEITELLAQDLDPVGQVGIKDTTSLGTAISLFCTMFCGQGNRWNKVLGLRTDAERAKYVRRHVELSALFHLVERIGQESFSLDICNPGIAEFEYPDALDSLVIVFDSKPFKSKLKAEGVDKVVDELEASYRHLAEQRSKAMDLLKGKMAAMGYHLDITGDLWWFGRKAREYPFDPRRALTLQLRTNDFKFVINEWGEKIGLPASTEGIRKSSIIKKRLPEIEGVQLPALKNYNQDNLKSMARNCIFAFKSHPVSSQRGLTKYWSNLTFFRSGHDSWVNDAWWRTKAKEHDEDLILAWYGDKQAHQSLLNRTRQYQHLSADFAVYEGLLSKEEVAFVMPHVWPENTEFDELHDWPLFFGPPPPILARKIAGSTRTALRKFRVSSVEDRDEAVDDMIDCLLRLDRHSVYEWLDEAEIQSCKDILLDLVSKDLDLDDILDTGFLDIVSEMNWYSIAEALQRNPSFEYMLPSFASKIGDSGQLALRLVRAQALDIGSRLAAYVLDSNAAGVRQCYSEVMKGMDLSSIESVVEYHVEEQLLAASIAWALHEGTLFQY